MGRRDATRGPHAVLSGMVCTGGVEAYAPAVMRGLLIVLGLVLCAVLGYTAVRLSGSGISEDSSAPLKPEVDKAAGSRRAQDGDRQAERPRSSGPERRQLGRLRNLGPGEQETGSPPPEPELMVGAGPVDPGVPSPEEKMARFKGALEQIDEELSRSYEPNPQRKAQLYQDLSESFQTITVNLNANDPEHLDYLEFARKELRDRMQALGVEGVRVGDADPKRGRPRAPSRP